MKDAEQVEYTERLLEQLNEKRTILIGFGSRDLPEDQQYTHHDGDYLVNIIVRPEEARELVEAIVKLQCEMYPDRSLDA